MIFDLLNLIVGIITLIVGGCGFLLTILEFRKKNHISRATFIKQIVEKINDDADINDVMYKVEYNVIIYDFSSHNGNYNDEERKVDKFLDHYSYICYLLDLKMITKKEFKFFDYKIKRILNNFEI